jgi:hypothetical protein
MNRNLTFWLGVVLFLTTAAFIAAGSGYTVSAQTAVPTATPTMTLTPYPLPLPNALVIYDKTTATLINVSDNPISVAGVSFMRAGDVVRLYLDSLGITTLATRHCVEWWTSSPKPNKPGECAARDKDQQLTKSNQYFWLGDYPNEPFRPELNNSALMICNTSAGRCLFRIMQGDEAKKPWVVLDPTVGYPLPPGLAVAYDANQMWIANLTPSTLLTTAALRVFYTVNGKPTEWTPANARWDGMSVWDGRSLAPNQCLVLYGVATQITPLLPCTPVGQTLNADHPWTLSFDVMGPREERRSPCGDGKSKNGPVLCLLGG